ncbi:unnamed protein product [Arctia plantaginis]|uniref:Uncharacterized protein n=1 Tax=Arctia plantaginis TaxID=874455 RepID=A0A8S0ZAS3_ARCPL|nr:unnamed protein product [Arctia plantaginis]
MPLDNTIRMDFYFYEYLTNRYRPSFVELHFGFCDMLEKDSIFGSQIKRHRENLTCPYPPRQYNLTKMSVTFIPKNFPFQRGRIYLNITRHENDKKALYVSAHIDMEIKNIIS